MKYPKIETVFNRDDKFKVIEGDYRLSEFENIKKWFATEKIDGTNIRVFFKDGKVLYGGRTDNAQLHVKLIEYLQNTFTHQSLDCAFPMNEDGFYPTIILFGEGYGPKIQKGGNYRPNISLRLFDVWVEDTENPLGGWWLEPENVAQIAHKLGVSVVPVWGLLPLEEIVEIVKEGTTSTVAQTEGGTKDYLIEGAIARTKPLMFTRRGRRVIWKIKTKDFRV